MTTGDRAPRVTWTPDGALDVVAALVKRRQLIVAVALIGFVASVSALLLLMPRYEVTASLLVREVKPAVATSGAGSGASQGLRPEDVNSEIEVLRSPHLIEKLVAHFGEEFFFAEPPPGTVLQRLKAWTRKGITIVMDAARELAVRAGLRRRLTRSERVILALQQSQTIEPVSRSDVIKVRLATADPEGGVALMTKFIDLYLEDHLASRTTPKAREFLEGQTSAIRTALNELEARRAEFKKAKAVWVTDEQRKLLVGQRLEVAVTLNNTQVEAAQVAAEIDGIQRRLRAIPSELRLSTTRQRNPVVDTLRNRLIELEGRREQLRGRYADDSRTIIDVDREITDARDALAREDAYVTQTVTSGINAGAQSIEGGLLAKQAALEGLRARATEQEKGRAVLDEQIRGADAADVELHRLEREAILLEQNYTLYAKNLEEARIGEALDRAKISNINVIAPPTASLSPVWPPRLILILGGGGGGLLSGLAAALLIEALRPTVRARSQVLELLGVPVLASIPDVKGYGRRA